MIKCRVNIANCPVLIVKMKANLDIVRKLMLRKVMNFPIISNVKRIIEQKNLAILRYFRTRKSFRKNVLLVSLLYTAPYYVNNFPIVTLLSFIVISAVLQLHTELLGCPAHWKIPVFAVKKFRANNALLLFLLKVSTIDQIVIDRFLIFPISVASSALKHLLLCCLRDDKAFSLN
ncbi:hypothetical protein BDF20DRAFT_991882 [Mycotypha africana]|uniref:uncharacterized protein n=1 Tax=Mycotypha africana TaxID=64632 RepID=UPI002300B97C|nr:uncharacterized protein BDF20DRAFT_991882 [Mycotypha africana]KAI8967573.1 hypothetical protein BDF20DRAFT_991882 [Mycotypha africana]